MKDSDKALVIEIRDMLDFYINDQKSNNPRHMLHDVPFGLQGHLADLQYAEKVENQALVMFLAGLVQVMKTKNQKETTNPFQIS